MGTLSLFWCGLGRQHASQPPHAILRVDIRLLTYSSICLGFEWDGENVHFCFCVVYFVLRAKADPPSLACLAHTTQYVWGVVDVGYLVNTILCFLAGGPAVPFLSLLSIVG